MTTAAFPTTRLRRNRQHPGLRRLIQETQLSVSDLVYPLFIHHGDNIRHPIASMPGQFQLSIDQLATEVESIVALGIPSVLLFGIPDHKDATGSSSLPADGLIQQAIIALKELAPDLLVMSDVCLCEYTDHGHCGVMNESTGRMDLDNDATLTILQQQAVSHARAGVDVIAPSGMIDGGVGAIRQALDDAGFSHIPILSYAVKYASSLYGPFRDAADGAPQFGDRRSHQMDPANASKALRETELDVQEGADMLMVKPAGAYLDIIHQVKAQHPGLPLAAYQVSGEYAMIKAAGEKGWIDEERVALESLMAIKRAGADFIITYFAKDVATLLNA